MSSSNSPCAACKCLRRKCTQECVYAPFFPPDQPQKFVDVHKVFGASNVAKLLNELPGSQREDAVNSLAYEARCRLNDPVYGCVGLISVLQHKLKQIQIELYNAKHELSTYISQSPMCPIMQQSLTYQQHPNNLSSTSAMAFNMQQPMMGLPAGGQLLNPQQQIVEAQQIAAAAAAEQELFRDYEQQSLPQQHELMRFNNGLDIDGVTSSATFNQSVATATSMCPSLGMGSYESALKSDAHPIELQLQSQMVLHHQNDNQDSPESAM